MGIENPSIYEKAKEKFDDALMVDLINAQQRMQQIQSIDDLKGTVSRYTENYRKKDPKKFANAINYWQKIGDSLDGSGEEAFKTLMGERNRHFEVLIDHWKLPPTEDSRDWTQDTAMYDRFAQVIAKDKSFGYKPLELDRLVLGR